MGVCRVARLARLYVRLRQAGGWKWKLTMLADSAEETSGKRRSGRR